ncbi:MAG: tyrosine-protein phosphatase [Burkholderiaceae bacterium]|nr:tyrosine-protein phosphatase [Burkholderiaceae bacterium]MDH3459807.1 tyrosine-protein phosphatase [Burkholderiaceae bacterium]
MPFFRPIALPPTAKGALWLHSMPGRLEPWEAFLVEARRTEVTLLVCLTPRYELASISPAYDAALTQGSLPMRWLHLPMRNFGLGDDVDAFRAGIEQTAADVTRGDIALLHCAAGIGRTGTAAACLLKSLGLPKDQALQRVRDAGSNPESAVQSGLVDTF